MSECGKISLMKKSLPLMLALCPLLTIASPMSIYADEAMPIKEEMQEGQVKKEGNGSGMSAEVDNMFNETNSQFSDLKDKYSSLASNYGNVPTSDKAKTYIDYMESLKNAKETTGFDEKMKAIQKTDISVNDARLESTFSKLKDSVTADLLKKGLNIQAPISKYNQQIQDKNEKQQETIKQAAAAAKKYDKFVDKYKELLVQEDGYGDKVKNPYANENMQALADSLGMSINESLNSGKGYNDKYLTTSEIFETLNQVATEKNEQQKLE